jgi:hypothetical protein
VGNGNSVFARRNTDIGLRRGDHEEEDVVLLNTPGDGRWDDGIDTLVATRVKRSSVAGTGTKGVNLTL